MSASSESLFPVTPAQIFREELGRVMSSATFRGSEVLRKLLSFLAKLTLEEQAESIKARDIAVAVFNRSVDFDPQSDSVVRVQMGRLRAKLAEHYIYEAPESEWVLGVPKGSYHLCCHARCPVSTPDALRESAEEAAKLTAEPAKAFSGSHFAAHFALVRTKLLRQKKTALAALFMFSAVFWAGRMMPARDGGTLPGTAVKRFWRPLAEGKESPLVVYSNQKLIGSVHSGLRIYNGDEVDVKSPIIQSWTTVGEVEGVFDVTKALAFFRKTPLVKPAHLLTWDEAKNKNLIVVGGPLSQTADIILFRDFQFRTNSDDPRIPSETGAIVNLRPSSGEAPLYVGPATRPVEFDYAVISLHASVTDGHLMLAMAGITEFGTEAAADFLTEESGLQTILEKLGVGRGGRVPWFEALLRVPVQDGVPLQVTIVAVRRQSS